MKSAYRKLVVTIPFIIALALLVTSVVNLARNVDRIQAGDLSQQAKPELLSGSYGNLLNNLLVAGGR